MTQGRNKYDVVLAGGNGGSLVSVSGVSLGSGVLDLFLKVFLIPKNKVASQLFVVSKVIRFTF